MRLVKKLTTVLLACFLFAASFCAARGNFSTGVPVQDTIMQRETLITDGIKYKVTNIDSEDLFSGRLYISDNLGRTIFEIKAEEGVVHFTIKDFNKDGYKDVVLDLMVANSGEQLLILYDPKTKKFVFAGNCSNAVKVPGTKYFYTYQDCCAGRNFSSDLFYISSSKIINVGHIKYEDGFGLSFYALRDEKKHLLQKWNVRINGCTPVTTGKHIDFDLGLYWAKHWQVFVK